MKRTKAWWSQFTPAERTRLLRIERWQGQRWYAVVASLEEGLRDACPGCHKPIGAVLLCRDCILWHEERLRVANR